jgi:DNA invertase Pin-like site-specific DNA recombinase
MIVGYARTSTVEPKASLEAQQAELERAGCEKIFREQGVSLGAAARGQLAAALTLLRSDDVLMVTKLDRLARSVGHLMQIVDELTQKGVSLRILNLGMDTATPTGKLILTVLGGIADFEREIMLERQREGIARAKAEGKFKGRKPTARAKAPEIRALMAGGMGASAVARQLGIGRNSVYRIMAEGETAP